VAVPTATVATHLATTAAHRVDRSAAPKPVDVSVETALANAVNEPVRQAIGSKERKDWLTNSHKNSMTRRWWQQLSTPSMATPVSAESPVTDRKATASTSPGEVVSIESIDPEDEELRLDDVQFAAAYGGRVDVGG